MTTKTRSETSPARVLRSSLRLSVPVGAVASVLVASPALADVPEGWPETPEVGAMDFLLLLLGLPLLAAAVIALAVYLPALARGEKISPNSAQVEDQWLGGPRQDRAELEESGAGSDRTGGASGSW